uniref:Amino acid transporter n=1 Tax=Periophthalmus magnuspinnatus TaxID=409849 RepID=A0A3B3ZK31_9GOBI
MVPSNLVEATFQQYKTDLVPILKVPTHTVQPSFVYVIPDESDPSGRTVYLELTPPPEVQYKTSPGTSQQMNVLGIVIFSATMGLLLGRMGERGAPLVNVCQCINECVMKIINAAVWYFPFGIIFLVAGKILDMADPSTLGKKLGWYGVTVLAGLFVHGLILLPLFYFILTHKNPFKYIRGLLQAMVIALATSSSSATLPITMKCLLENCRVDRQIARFVLPVGATINMDGTALYEAVAAIFIAQVNDYELDFGQLVTISITATAASIGAAGIPQAGLVTMVIVLTSVGLPPDDITLIVAIDWILDRFRTMINVLGDALAAGIIAHLCRKDFPLSESGKVRELTTLRTLTIVKGFLKPALVPALVPGPVCGLVPGLDSALDSGLVSGPVPGLVSGPVPGLVSGPVPGLVPGLDSALDSALDSGVDPFSPRGGVRRILVESVSGGKV